MKKYFIKGCFIINDEFSCNCHGTIKYEFTEIISFEFFNMTNLKEMLVDYFSNNDGCLVIYGESHNVKNIKELNIESLNLL